MKITNAAATTLQVLGTALLGLMAGFFFALSLDLWPAMLQPDVQEHVNGQQAIDRVLLRFPFTLVYFGAVLLPPLAALALWLSGRTTQAQVWFVIGVVYLVGVFLLTGQASIPINDALAQWNTQSAPAHWMRDRDQQDRADLLRCITACISFGAALAALAWRPRPGPLRQ